MQTNYDILNVSQGTVGSDATVHVSLIIPEVDLTVNNIGCFIDFDNTATIRLGVYDSSNNLLGETNNIVAGALGTGHKTFSVITPFAITCKAEYFVGVKVIDNGSGNGFTLGSRTVLNDSKLSKINNFDSGDPMPDPLGTTNSQATSYYISLST